MTTTQLKNKAAAQSHPGTPDMSIVLVNWNNLDYLEPCLVSLFESDLNCRYDVVVVDQGSTDGSQKMLEEKYPSIRLIQNSGNVGLARACNQGIEATTGRYILLLNNDTLVNSSLGELVTFLDKTPQAGAVGGRLLNADGSFQAGFANFSTLLEEFLIATHLGELFQDGYPSHQDLDRVQQVGWISSACLLLRRSALDDVGLLAEDFFIYGDEADLQYRLNHSGWPVYYLPTVNTLHYGGKSMNRWKRRRMVYRGKMLFYRKNYGRLRTAALRLLFGSLSVGKMIPWALAYGVPSQRDRAKKELTSNIEVVSLCLKLE